MGIVGAYSVLAVVFFSLSIGWFKPKRWNELTNTHVKVLRIGCFFGFLVIVANIVAKFVEGTI